MRGSRLGQVAVFLGVATAMQLATMAGGKGYLLTQLTMSAYYTLEVLGLSLLMGLAGQISLGHAGFFSIGGYISAALTTWEGIPVLRLRGHYVAMATLGVGTIICSIDLGTEVLGAADGISA